MNSPLDRFVRRLHAHNQELWKELQKNPNLIKDPQFQLTMRERKLLTHGPRADLLKAACRPPGHTAIIMFWIDEKE